MEPRALVRGFLEECSMSLNSILKHVLLVAAAVTVGTLAVGVLSAQTAALKAPATLREQAPATYNVTFDTSAGAFTVQVTRAWAPLGADRFYNLVKNGYYNGARFFRVIPGFMVQFGINGDPALNRAWQTARIQDDPVKQSNTRGMVTFAHAGPNSRTTQVFINFGNNAALDRDGFPPFGRVTSGMDVVDKINGEYGEGAPRGRGPDQGRVQAEGNAYLTKEFPKLDYIKTATIETAAAPAKK
jgi:peptidyl-prolyl cis-trans isomerase A (cyclophilin A)